MGHRLSKTAAVSQEAWSAPHAIFAVSPALMQGFSVTYRHQAGTKFPKSWSSCESRAKQLQTEVRIALERAGDRKEGSRRGWIGRNAEDVFTGELEIEAVDPDLVVAKQLQTEVRIALERRSDA
jgi:hypothetical protein